MFIVVEGIDGSGKSTAVQTVSDFLSDRNIPHITTKDNGSTDLGESVRSLLLNEQISMSKDVEALLLNASRLQLVEEVILPYIDKGFWVVCDRFYWSTLAYQNSPIAIQSTNLVANKIKPDLTIFLDCNYNVAKKRILNRDKKLDKFEKKGEVFFNSVRNNYLKLYDMNKNAVLINAKQNKDLVKMQIITALRIYFEENIYA